MKEKIKFKYVPLNAGSIMIWESDNKFIKSICNLLKINKKPKYKACIISGDTSYVYWKLPETLTIVTPIRRYNKKEVAALDFDNYEKDTIENVVKIANSIRPNTFISNGEKLTKDFIVNNPYYRTINIVSESKELII